jgi:hypothetical protein
VTTVNDPTFCEKLQNSRLHITFALVDQIEYTVCKTTSGPDSFLHHYQGVKMEAKSQERGSRQ